jgi:hypothetical protein
MIQAVMLSNPLTSMINKLLILKYLPFVSGAMI